MKFRIVVNIKLVLWKSYDTRPVIQIFKWLLLTLIWIISNVQYFGVYYTMLGLTVPVLSLYVNNGNGFKWIHLELIKLSYMKNHIFSVHFWRYRLYIKYFPKKLIKSGNSPSHLTIWISILIAAEVFYLLLLLLLSFLKFR